MAADGSGSLTRSLIETKLDSNEGNLFYLSECYYSYSYSKFHELSFFQQKSFRHTQKKQEKRRYDVLYIHCGKCFSFSLSQL